MIPFQLISDFKPKGDQPEAIEKILKSIDSGNKYQTLLGVTGSGKTFTIANIIAKLNRPVLVMSHNKTLAAQLYSEFKDFFKKNGVGYFVSYYDYYQPESYVPRNDLYIEKDASINDEIDKLRLAATSNLLSRNDALIVSSVSCIYGLGSPIEYKKVLIEISVGMQITRREILVLFLDNRYERNDVDFSRGSFRVKGDVIDIFPAYLECGYRIELEFDCVQSISEIHPTTGEPIAKHQEICIYPAKHFLTNRDMIKEALISIKEELAIRLEYFQKEGKLLEAQRLESRTKYDMEMLEQVGYCTGIENYSRHLSDRKAGSKPYCLLDYFPNDYLIIIDESHVTVPQIRGMYYGDRSRKETLVEYGFRLPSALDNRPLNFDEFIEISPQILFASATPGDFEKKVSTVIAEQLIRPTGLLDPPIEVRPTTNQIDDLLEEIKKRSQNKQRTLVTTLTKRMAEDLTSYIEQMGIRVRYIHSEIDAIERVDILKSLRQHDFDCLIGVNLLREGLDLPEVSLVAVMDADKEGFLRSQTSLIQVAGRAARNIDGHVIMYGDSITDSMKYAISETDRRRKLQLIYNKKHRIKPQTINKAIRDGIEVHKKAEKVVRETAGLSESEYDTTRVLNELEELMYEYSRNLNFEMAAKVRDKIQKLKKGHSHKKVKKSNKTKSKYYVKRVIKKRPKV